MKFIHVFLRLKWYILVTAFLAGGLFYYFNVYKTDDAQAASSFYVVDTVAYGEVTSGIETTGDIIAAQKLDIDVYKRTSRIDVVNVQNGSHVEADQVLISFDKSDAYVDTESARVAVAEAELALQEEREDVADPNTQILAKRNQIAGYEKTIADAKQDMKDAYRDFLNEDLEVAAHPDKENSLADRTTPTLGGRYVSDEEGVYVVSVYSSGAASGFSYSVTGLEGGVYPVILGKADDLGTRGLTITFPNNTRNGDKWIVHVPNTEIATYTETKADYEDTIANLEKTIRDAEVSLASAQLELKDLLQTDTTMYRDLDVEKAQTELAAARQRLTQNYDVVQERDIVAPFAGTVEGMENVVVGATPTGGSEDSINLGTLISDEFLTTFTLGAADVAKVEVGQKVKVTVTSFSEQPVFDAYITQISSLPESSGVAQYEVQALLDYSRETASIVLREGMLADIEVVEKEADNTLRVPTSAITYEQGQPKVTVIDELTEKQQMQVERMGIVRTDGVPLVTYTADVELGIVGQYYVEIKSGVNEGDLIVASSLTTESAQSVVGQAGLPGSGAGRRMSEGGAPPDR